MSTTITQTSETVRALRLTDDYVYTVGGNGITAIEPYDEIGQGAYVPWFNVWRGRELWLKVNAAHVRAIEYVQEGGQS